MSTKIPTSSSWWQELRAITEIGGLILVGACLFLPFPNEGCCKWRMRTPLAPASRPFFSFSGAWDETQCSQQARWTTTTWTPACEGEDGSRLSQEDKPPWGARRSAPSGLSGEWSLWMRGANGQTDKAAGKAGSASWCPCSGPHCWLLKAWVLVSQLGRASVLPERGPSSRLPTLPVCEPIYQFPRMVSNLSLSQEGRKRLETPGATGSGISKQPRREGTAYREESRHAYGRGRGGGGVSHIPPIASEATPAPSAVGVSLGRWLPLSPAGTQSDPLVDVPSGSLASLLRASMEHRDDLCPGSRGRWPTGAGWRLEYHFLHLATLPREVWKGVSESGELASPHRLELVPAHSRSPDRMSHCEYETLGG